MIEEPKAWWHYRRWGRLSQVAYWLECRLNLFPNGHKTHDQILEAFQNIVPWSAFSCRHCQHCNSEYHIKHFRALLLIRRLDRCTKCGSKTRDMTGTELERRLFMPGATQ